MMEQKIEKKYNVKVRLLGIFKEHYGNGFFFMDISQGDKLKTLVDKLARSSVNLKKILIDPELNNPIPNTIILINGKEIGVLDGLNTTLYHKDEIVFIPVTHGG